MIKGELQYISDTLLMDELAKTYCNIQKQASLFDFAFNKDDIQGTFSDIGKQQAESADSKDSFLENIGNALIHGAIFKWHPVLGLLSMALEAVGISPTDIASKIWNTVKGMLSSGKQVTPADVQRAAESAAGSVVTGSADLLRPLKIVLADKNKPNTADWLTSKLTTLLPGKLKMITAGILGWVITSLLFGAGLMIGGRAIGNWLGTRGDSPKQQSAEPLPEGQADQAVQTYVAPAAKIPFRASGNGEQVHDNDGSSKIWIVPLINGDIEATLAEWAVDVYPELKPYKSKLMNNRALNMVASKMKKDGPNHMIVSPEFKSRKQAVDAFVSTLGAA